MKGAVWPKVGLDEIFIDPDGRVYHCPVGTQVHTPDHGGKPHQVGEIFRLVGQGVAKKARGLGDKVGVKRLQLGPFGLAMRLAKLRPLRQPRGCERRQPADCRSCQGGECRI